MEIEIPCRDTDPIDGKMVTKGETLAFTIDFGGSDTSSEKAKKFERFAQRSSQRRTASPRDVKQENNEAMTNQASWTQTDKTLGKLCTDYHQEKKNISKERATIQNEKVQNVQRTFDRIKIKDLEIDNEDEKDEVRSSTGTYVMEDEEELKEVNFIKWIKRLFVLSNQKLHIAGVSSNGQGKICRGLDCQTLQ